MPETVQLPAGISDVDIPMWLRDLHLEAEVGAELALDLTALDEERRSDLLIGAGFDIGRASPDLVVRNQRTLADSVGGAMRLLLVGLNPSLTAADLGYGFASPSNRFWRAAIGAGLLSEPCDPAHALIGHRVGMTDLVKRATAKAAELRAQEYRDGLGRLDRLCAWLKPDAVCVAGVTGWRAATGDKHAALGWQKTRVGDRPTYVMPNPSGLNAHTNHADLVQHLTTALAGS